MKDSDIRKILIEYIKITEKKETRIYQEKNIGSSICDLMAVNDCLTGYEIKSDTDNYERLPSQIKAYNNFFDRNYAVVGKTHADYISKKIPENWGILCITENSIIESRPAGNNHAVSRRNQLKILWKIELQNLLTKNNLPFYAQKDKGFISDRITEAIAPDILGKQIAEELLHRDYSIYDAKDYSVKIGTADIGISELEVVDALSEEDISEMTLDRWIAIYRKAKEISNTKKKILRKRKIESAPNAVPFESIEVSIGAPFLTAEIMNDFAIHLADIKSGIIPLYVEYSDYTGTWHVNRQRAFDTLHNNNLTYVYGTSRYNALQILDATLNLREIKVNDASGRFSEKETVAALAKQKLIQDEFKNWIWEDEDRRWIVEDNYNRMFGGFCRADYDGSKLSFPQMNEKYQLFDYQKDAVQKIISSENTLLAFDVGAGKTYIMIAAAMLMRQNGLSRKNMFVVPNNIVGQWAKIFTELYPTAKILTVEPKNFKPEMRSKVLHQMKTSDYDGIIIAYSCFEMIPVSEHLIRQKMNERLDGINAEMKRIGYCYSFNGGELQREKDRILKLTEEFLASIKSEVTAEYTFDQLEINTLFLDEAHNYKNLPIKTRLNNLNGINTKGSKKCYDMMLKVRTVQEMNDGRGAVFATGTPLCNSIADTYVMQMYLQPEEMAKCRLDIFDNWVKMFAAPQESLEVDVDTSKFRIVRRFAYFFNLAELSKMFSQIAVFYAVKDQDYLPEFDGYTKVVIEKNEPLQAYMKRLCERAEMIRSGVIDKKHDNMLKVSTDGRKAVLSLQLVGEAQKYDDTSKIKRCVTEVLSVYLQYDGCSQLIFCDYSTPKNGDYDVYHDLKCRLTKAGIPDKEIAFVHSARTESSKLALYEKVNSGKVRILIGSTFKLGIGANVQTKLKAVHHLDVPWRPADMVQREGRIMRRGNENKSIMIFRYISEGSFDAYSWQILETKQRFISQFLAGTAYQKSVTDLENNVLSYAEVKALALSQPLMKTLAETENELKNLKLLKIKEDEARELLKTQIELDEKRLSAISPLSRYDKDIAYFAVKKRTEIMESLSEISIPILKETFEQQENGKLSCQSLGIILRINCTNTKPELIIHSTKTEEDYYTECSEDDHANRLSIVRTLKSLNILKQKRKEESNKLSDQIKKANQELAKENDYETKVLECQERYEKLKELAENAAKNKNLH